MPRKLTDAEIAAVAVVPNNDEMMDNGEKRLRRMFKDGSGYIRVEAGSTGEWQNSHYHEGVRETTIVQKGWVAEVNLFGSKPAFCVHGPGSSFTSRVQIHHNQYLASGSLTHTVKFGDCTKPKDWHASPKLDAIVKHLTEDDILRLAGLTPEEGKEFRRKAFA